MTDHRTEADARILIDEMLRRAGWDPANKADVLTEVPVVLDSTAEAAPGELPDSDTPKRADYVLLDQQGRPLAVVEAKKKAIDPYTAKNQTLPYAEKLDAAFIFLSNGEQIYFWDYALADARPVASFFSRRDLERIRDLRRHRLALASVPIPEFYQSHGETFRFRDYQSNCLRAIDRTIELGKRRFLAELPTGTGKTDVICQQIKRLIDSGHVERVLFLVDRDQLAKQSLDALFDLLPNHSSYWLKAGAALGLVKTRPREEQLEENFRAWLIAKQFTPPQVAYLQLLKNRGLAVGHITVADLFKPPLQHLNAAATGTELFGEEALKAVIADLDHSVFATSA